MDLNAVMYDHTLKMVLLMNNRIKFYEKYVGCPIFVKLLGPGPFGDITGVDMNHDPYYQQIYKQTLIDGITIRTWFENSIGTRDFKGNRLNIYFKKVNKHLHQIEKVYFG